MIMTSKRISDIKQIIFDSNKTSIESQRLFFKGELLEDDEFIDKYGIDYDDTIQLDII